MVNELLRIALKPEGPLQILQASLELYLQLVVHTLHACEQITILLPQGKFVPMKELGYEAHLCSMALVNAAASWEGFKGNLVRAIRDIGHSFSEGQLHERLQQISSYPSIIEPLARRDCIVHNLSKVDRDYEREIQSSPLHSGETLTTDLNYLKEASFAFFNTAAEFVSLLVDEGLLAKEHREAIGEFQRDPVILKTGTMVVRKKQ